ncbi:MAG: DMT family transporter, partial [Bryobacteraceae bacterium]
TLPGMRLQVAPGDLFEIACAFCFAAHIVVLGHFAGRVSFTRLSLYQIATAALLGAGTFWWVETPRIRWTPTVLFALAVTGLLATALAFAVQTWAQQHTSPTHTALVFALEPVFAWLTAFAATGEILSRQAAIGAALILAGILLVEMKPVHTGRNQPA